MEKRDVRMMNALMKREQLKKENLDNINKNTNKWDEYRNELV